MEIALIGHGRSPAGKGWGPSIDTADVVVRFWDCHWQDAADYGTAYDVGVYTAMPNELRYQKVHQKREPCEWWCYDLRGNRERAEADEEVIRPAPWVKRLTTAGYTGARGRLELSRGTAAACHAIVDHKPDRLVLIGFDAVHDGNLPADHYPAGYRAALAAMERRADMNYLGPATATHHFAGERVLIETLAREQKVEILWGFG